MGHFSLRYLYTRSSDTRQADERGQDYIAFRHDERRVVFAVCDGVSQSFFGDLAARFLGDALVDWLWNSLPTRQLREESIERLLRSHLRALTSEATETVQALSLPGEAPPMLRDVLEHKRSIGSETMFVCGSLEMPGPELPGGHVVLAWMGDSELQLWSKSGDRTKELDADWETARRWSSKVGPKGGSVGVFVGSLRDTRRVLAYSDGICSLREQLGRGMSDSGLKEGVNRLSQTPASDDISFLEIEILPEPAPIPVPTALTVPAFLRSQRVNGSIRVSWDPVPRAEGYELEWTGPAGERESLVQESTLWISPREPVEGVHTFRVRAVAEGQSSDWSPPKELQIPVVPPIEVPPPTIRPPVHWLNYAGAGILFMVLCLFGALGARWVLRRTGGVLPPEVGTTATSRPARLPGDGTTSPTGTPVPRLVATLPPAVVSPVVTSTEPVSSSPTPTLARVPTEPATQSPVMTPTESVSPSPPATSSREPTEPAAPSTNYQPARIPPAIAPIEGEARPPESALVVVGGTELAQVEETLYTLRIAQRDGTKSQVSFRREPLPAGVSADQVQWVWLIYRMETSSRPVLPLYISLVLADGKELHWGSTQLLEGEAWVFGVDADAGLRHFLVSVAGTEESAPILVRGSWTREAQSWKLRVAEFYRLDSTRGIYVRKD
jgi:hypothetical protein